MDNNNNSNLEERQFVTGQGQPSGWAGPYISDWPESSWGRTFKLVDSNSDGRISSAGYTYAIEIYKISTDGHSDIRDGIDDLVDGGDGLSPDYS